jgi:hypothetical protein
MNSGFAQASQDFWRDYYLAGDTDVTGSRLARFAMHEHHVIRRRLAENASIPSLVQYLLAKDSSVDVRLALASNPSALPSILITMVGDSAPVVRLALAGRTDLPIASLMLLSRDANQTIRERAHEKVMLLLSKAIDEAA